jgi:flavin reductase (DIM6/NTAB) family NADH-FMN oxidoreductase RutF
METDPLDLNPSRVHRLLSGCVAPRPVALLSTVSPTGVVNVAPFSMVTPLSAAPALIGVAIHPRQGAEKDTLRNIRAVGDFVVNVVTAELLEHAVAASAAYPPEAGEAAALGMTLQASDCVRSPRVAASPTHLECVLSEILAPTGTEARLVVGRVVRIHIDDGLLHEGELAPGRLMPVGHLASLRDGYLFTGPRGVVRLGIPVTAEAHAPPTLR